MREPGRTADRRALGTDKRSAVALCFELSVRSDGPKRNSQAALRLRSGQALHGTPRSGRDDNFVPKISHEDHSREAINDDSLGV